MRPAQKGSKVHQAGCKYALLVFERREVDIRISLAQLLSTFLDEQRDMTELRWSPLEGIV
jgi:hypothetical protein